MNPAEALPPAAGGLPDHTITTSTSTRFHVLLGWWLIIGGLGGFLLWAALAPLDQGVPLTGQITVSGNRKTVQHQSGGTVDAILVAEGERVQAGQVLVRMNSVQARANAEITRIQLQTAEATLNRLEAETGSRSLGPVADRDTAGHSQHQLLLARQRAMQSELAAMDETIAGLEAMNRSLVQSRSSRQEQLRLLGEQLESTRVLSRDGFVARNRVLDLEREHAQVSATLAEESGSVVRNERQIGELRLRRLQRQQEFQRDVHSQLADIRQEVQMLRNRLQGLDHELASAEVRSPVDGVVADISIFTEGGVVTPGFKLMDILPTDQPLLIEAEVPVDAIDSVRPGLPVEVMVAAFNQNTTPRIPAEVVHVSPDRIVDERSGQVFYRMRARTTTEGEHLIRRLDVKPGMPVEIYVRTGERTLLNYIFRPLRDSFRMSMTEE
jgi:membrane fusion protein, protease secretion system